MTTKKILFISLTLIVVVILSFLFRCRIYDNRINQLNALCEHKEQVVSDMVTNVYKSDVSSVDDIKYMDMLFNELFTFYNLDDFEMCISLAKTYNLPQLFIDSFYNKNELSGLYADSMLDVMCKFDSADYYLLDRTDTACYYYANVCLDTVKYSHGTFNLAFFITLENQGDNRISSIIYYNID